MSTCNCKAGIEAKLLERFKGQQPNAEKHGVILSNYGMAIQDNKVIVRPFMEYSASAIHPLKKGGTKLKKTTGNMFFSFCPFCGVKIESEA